MADYRDHRSPGRSDPRGFGNRSRYEQHGGHQRHDHERDRERTDGGFGRDGARDRMGSEQFRSQEARQYGDHPYRDFGHGQSVDAYEHSGSRDYRYGSGYGGFGESPGESGGGFGSGRTYAAEPGWGPDYGQHGGDHRDGRGLEQQGGPPGSYSEPGGFGHHARARGYGEPGRFARDQFGQGPYRGYAEGDHSSSGFGPSGMDSGRHGQPFGEVGPTYGRQGFGQSHEGYGGEHGQAAAPRHGRGPKGYQRSDERLKEDVSEHLMFAVDIEASDVSVEVKDGKVTLEGTVPERRMKHRIEDIADACMGVKDIDNRIRVAPGGFGEAHSEATLSIGGGSQNAGASSAGAGQGSGGASVSASSATGRGK